MKRIYVAAFILAVPVFLSSCDYTEKAKLKNEVEGLKRRLNAVLDDKAML